MSSILARALRLRSAQAAYAAAAMTVCALPLLADQAPAGRAGAC